MTSENRGLIRVVDATRYSWLGVKAAYENEEAFRQELVLGSILAIIAFFIADNGIELALLLGSLMLVLITELLNSAVEAIVDRVGMEKHELSGRAKDIGSAAVMLSMFNVVIIWACIIIG